MIEIERRIKLTPQSFDQLFIELNNSYGGPLVSDFQTILLKGPHSDGRLRVNSMQPNVIVFTAKEYIDGLGSAKEYHEEFGKRVKEIAKIKRFAANYSLQSFIYFPTKRYTFSSLHEVKLELSDHHKFGKFLEIEKILPLDEDASKVDLAQNYVDRELERMELTPMDNEEYHKHYEEVFSVHGHDIAEIDVALKEMIQSKFSYYLPLS